MKLSIVFIIISFFLLSGCATKKPLNLNEISSKPTPPQFDFKEFYKTSGISGVNFSNDSKVIYFLKSDGKVKNIFSYTIKNKKTAQVTKYNEPVSGFITDPNSKYLYIQKDKGGSEVYDLFRFDLKNGKTLALTNGKGKERSYLCNISPDGKTIYYSQSRKKRAVYDIKQINTKTLKSSILLRANTEQYYCDALNEDGTKLAFISFVDNNERHLLVADTSTYKTTLINGDKGVNNSSPQFVGNNTYYLSTKNSDIYNLWKYNANSKKSKKVKTGVKGSLDSLSIYNNGTKSIIGYRGKFKSEVKVFKDLFKTELKTEIDSRDITGATFSQYNDNFGILVKANSSTPDQYYIVDGSKLTKFYDSNQSKIKSKFFAKSQSQFVKSFDGVKIPTHFFIPNGTSPTNKKPVIFWIHGGPEDHVDPVFSSRIQFLTNRGFIVVAPNVRGSTGFGKKYQFMDNKDWGGGHIKDIVAVAEYSKTLSFVDKDNVFIVGGSFGGFSVMSLITQYPKVFKAAVDIFGLVEMASFMESWPPLAQDYWISEMGKDPRKDKAFNKSLSPIYHVQNIQIPLQVHQGANDIRVAKSQSDMLVKRLKKMNKPVDYIVYPDEGHGFLKFENSQRCFESIVKFYSQYL